MKQARFYISLFIIIPVIVAGLTILSALVSFRLTEYFMKNKLNPDNPVFFWVLGFAFAAFLCGLVLVRFLLNPTMRFVEKTRNLPAVTTSDPDIRKTRRASELEHVELLFDTVADVLNKVDARQTFPEIIGESHVMRGIMSQIMKVAPTDSTVLIFGESGTGKELIADCLYRHSRRNKAPFVKLNCAAIPSELLESELFGHEKGAFTGAASNKPGKFELAHGGTIFLDEIGDMPLDLQAKVLRVLQEKEFYRVGGTKPLKVDVRFIAATNKSLKTMVADGRFREDLFYRLNVVALYLPPLKDRAGDIPLLIDHFLEKYPKELTLSPPALQVLMNYGWPGNIRELQNIIERAVVMCEEEEIDLKHLPAPLAVPKTPVAASDGSMEENKNVSIDEYLRLVEKQMIMEALKKSQGVQVDAARLLGINQRSLWHRVKKHNIDVTLFKTDNS